RLVKLYAKHYEHDCNILVDRALQEVRRDLAQLGVGSLDHDLSVMDDIQRQMWEALDGNALTVEQLANKVGCEPSFLYKHGLKSFFVANGWFKHKPGVGFFRPNSPPKDRLPRKQRHGKK